MFNDKGENGADNDNDNACQHAAASNVRGKRYSMAALLRARVSSTCRTFNQQRRLPPNYHRDHRRHNALLTVLTILTIELSARTA